MTTLGAIGVDLGWMMSRGKQGREGDDSRRTTFGRKHRLGLDAVVLCNGVALTLPGTQHCAVVDDAQFALIEP